MSNIRLGRRRDVNDAYTIVLNKGGAWATRHNSILR
jgi:hypothetical protein